MNRKTKIGLVVFIVLFILGIVFHPQIKSLFTNQNEALIKADPPSGKQSGNRELNVNAEILGYQDLTEVFRTKGKLIPDEEVDLSFETSGKITYIYFKEGRSVKKGELLAKVNDKPLQAELKKLEAQLPLAKERVFRQKSLLAKDAVSQEAYESVTTDLEKLEADIELVKAKITQTELRAPFDGVIGLRLVSDGAYASPTTIISKLTKISPIKIEFSVNEGQVNDIRPETIINFTTENDANSYQASVYAVESILDEQTLTLKARAVYSNKDGRLKPGQSANINIRLREIKNTITIPSRAIIAEMGRDIVYTYKEGKAHQVTILKGMRTASSVQILTGLNIGDTLLVSGVMQLRDGLPIKIDELTHQTENK